jgi:hypothetical protein
MIAHKNIQEAMVAIMAEADPIAKKRDADRYKFRGVDDVYQALQLVMASHGVFTTSNITGAPDYTEYTTGKGVLTFRTRAVFRFTFHHVSETSVSTETIGEGMDTGDKASNKSMSVAHKYALLQAFMIPTADAKDPEEDSHEVVKKAPPTSTKRTELIAHLGTIKPRLSQAQILELTADLQHAGTTDAMLDAVRTKADGFLAGEKTLDEAAALFDGEVEK